MSKTKITAPVADYSGAGPGGLTFKEGVAYTDDEAIIAYCLAAGYGVQGEQQVGDNPLSDSELAAAKSLNIDTDQAPAEVRRQLNEPFDPRDLENGGIVTVGTPLRDAAVDPRPGDFLPPTNAGEANPHGPLVVAPGIHAVGTEPVRPGEVFVDDTARQEAAETDQAVKLLVEGQDVGEALPSFERGDEGEDGSDTGPLGLSDPGSAHIGVQLAAEQPDAQVGENGMEEVTSPSAEPAVEQPAKNASLGAWQDYARARGASDADLDGKTRKDLIAAYGS